MCEYIRIISYLMWDFQQNWICCMNINSENLPWDIIYKMVSLSPISFIEPIPIIIKLIWEIPNNKLFFLKQSWLKDVEAV
jgi:hypothetical protein